MNLEDFLNDRTLIALKTSSSALGKGIFKKEFTVPLHTAALVWFPDGSSALAPEGRKLEGEFQIVIAKTATVVLELLFPDLRSSDGHVVGATIRVAVAVDARRTDVFMDFAKSLFTFQGSYSTRDLKNFLGPEVKRAASEIVTGQPAERVHRKDLTREIGDRLGSSLERLFFGQGIRFEKLVDASFVSTDYEGRQKAEAKRAEDEKRVAVEREDKEKQIRRFLGFLEDPQVKGILETLPDQRIKGMILAELLHDKNASITAEELLRRSSKHGEEVVQAILESLERLMGGNTSIAKDQVATEHAERIYIAAGHAVYELRPGETEPVEHAFPEALRSVRFAGRLLGGSKRAVYAIPPSGQLLGYPLPGARDPKGGVNSIAAAGPYLFATHSEFGVARWKSDEPGAPGELLYADLTQLHKTTRAAQVSGDRLYFATGPEVYAASVGDGERPVRYRAESTGTVTCLAVSGSVVFAGTEDGAIWMWDSPENPKLVARKKERVVTLRVARVGGIPHLFYSTRDLAVRARALGLNLEIAFESGGASVDFLDAASDLVCASDTTGRKLLIWKSTSPTQPEAEIDIWKRAGKPILDIWMKKTAVSR